MNPNTLETLRRLCLVPLTALCLVPMARAQTSATLAASMPRLHMMPAADGSDGMKSSMMTGMDGMQKMQMSGDTDKDFAMMMKMHHQQGIKMARMELAHGKSPAMKTMAKQIVSAQNKEVRQLDQWLARQK